MTKGIAMRRRKRKRVKSERVKSEKCLFFVSEGIGIGASLGNGASSGEGVGVTALLALVKSAKEG